jgi:excisionase family DNA binding protein
MLGIASKCIILNYETYTSLSLQLLKIATMEQQKDNKERLGITAANLEEWFNKLNSLDLIEEEAYLNNALLNSKNPKALLFFLKYELLPFVPSIDVAGIRFKWKFFLNDWVAKNFQKLESLESSSDFAETLQRSLQTGLMKEKLAEYVETTLASKDMLSMAEVLAYLKISKPTLYKLEENGKLPRFRVGRRVLYKRTDVEKVVTG